MANISFKKKYSHHDFFLNLKLSHLFQLIEGFEKLDYVSFSSSSSEFYDITNNAIMKLKWCLEIAANQVVIISTGSTEGINNSQRNQQK